MPKTKRRMVKTIITKNKAVWAGSSIHYYHIINTFPCQSQKLYLRNICKLYKILLGAYMSFKKNVVILGGGFSGTRTALELVKKAYELNIRITLIDKNNYHLFTPSLYEIATSEEPQKNIAIPLKEIFGTKVSVASGELALIDTESKFVRTKNRACFYYDYLIIALGSEPAYFAIPGLIQHSFPLKTLSDAIEIQKAIINAYHRKEKSGVIDVVVGGGGFSGTELVAELITFRERLAKQLCCKDDCMRLTLIQKSDRLLRELDENVSDIAKARLKKYGVRLYLGEHVKSLSHDCIMTDMGSCYKYDIFIWTGGVKASSIIAKLGFSTNAKGQLVVNNYLQVVGHDNIFAVGDNAEFIEHKTKKHAPQVAEVAEKQGKVAAENIYRIIKRLPLKEYKLSHFGYIVPLKGHFAILELNSFYIIGFLGWIAQQIVLLRYLLGILPFFKAFKRWNKFESELKQT